MISLKKIMLHHSTKKKEKKEMSPRIDNNKISQNNIIYTSLYRNVLVSMILKTLTLTN